MENIHDWAVGRQLWWGHRIPAWFCRDGHITVSDLDAMVDVSGVVSDACARCHDKYRETPKQPEDRCTP